MLNIFNIVNDFFGEAKHYESGGEIEVLINQGIIDLLFYETTPMHAKEYGLIAENPLYVQRLCVSENQRLKGIGKRVLEYIDNYAFENGNDVIFGHIEENASFTKDSRQSNLCDVDMIKKLLNSKGYETIIGNNDFYKVITNYAKGGSVLLAPNGKPSNLTPEQYKLVRTPEFKAWFGDWENDPENSSKVVDSNGEPLVCYHGTPKKEKFYEFKIVGGADKKSKKQLLFGSHFASNLDDANIYRKGKGNVYEVFLNIKNILGLEEHYEKDNPKFNAIIEIIKELKIDKKFKNSMDYTLFTDSGDYGGLSKEIQRVFLNQIMLDSYPPKRVFDSLKNKFDGIYYIPYQPQGFNYFSNFSKSFIAFEPNQIKLADGNNTTFDSSNPDIRFADGGTLSEDMAMVKSDLMMLSEYAKKISDLVQPDKKFVAWVIAKIGKVEQTTASVKHALKAQHFEKGGSVEGSDGETIRMMCLHIGKYADSMLKMVESGIEFQSWMKHELAIAANMIDSVFHYLDYFYSGNHLKQGGSIAQRKKVGKVMHEYKTGKLKSHGKVVTDRNQAIAIALSEAGLSKKEQGGIIEQFQLPAADFVPINNGGIPSYNTPSDHWELYYEKGGKIKNK